MAEEQDHCLILVEEKRLVILPVSSLPLRSSESVEVDIEGKKCQAVVLYKGSKQRCVRHAETLKVVSRITSLIDKESSEDETRVAGNEKQEESKKELDHRTEFIARVLFKLLSHFINGDEDGADVHRASCDGCERRRIRGDRYKCLECDNYDLCGDCFERGVETKHHKSGHVFAHFKLPEEIFGEPVKNVNEEITLDALRERFAKEEHGEGMKCEACGDVIVGLRFKCDTCRNVNLCFNCMKNKARVKSHLPTHSLIAIGKDALQKISIDDIQLGEELGRGSFGAVHKAKWLSKNIDVACKLINLPADEDRAEANEKSFRKELAAYQELSGIYILKTYGYGERILSNGSKQLMLVMEYMKHGSLRSLIKKEKLSIRRKLDMACHIASGMRKLHAHQMIHRDIRPDNILVNDSYQAKIGDMGIAREYQSALTMTQIGCGKFMPPEFYKQKYDQSLDVFTFGLTLNELFTETEHKLAIDLQLVCPKVVRQQESPVFEELIERCIRPNPRHRPSANEIETTLRLYRGASLELITTKYVRMDPEERNKVFLAFYQEFHPQAMQELAKRFPPAPSLSEEGNTESDTQPDIDPSTMVMLMGMIAEYQ